MTRPKDSGILHLAMGGRATNEGTDFQARVAAYIAAHILVSRPLPHWTNISVVPTALTCETGTAGDDICVETTAGTILDLQAKHGLNADNRLQETIDRFARLLGDADIGIIAVDIEGSSKTIRVTLQRILDAWRQGQEPEIPTDLLPRIHSLCEGRGKNIRSRIAIASFHLDDDHAHGVAHAEELLRGRIADRSRAALAWSVLVQDGQYAAKRGARRDRDYYQQILFNKGIELASEEQALLMAPNLKIKPGISAALPEVPPLLQAASSLIKSHQPAAALAILDHYKEAHNAKYHMVRGAALFSLDQLDASRLAFEEALKTDKTLASGYVNLATLELVTGNRVRAKDYAVTACTLDPDAAAAWAIRVQVDDQWDITDVPSQLQSHPDIAAAIARVNLTQGDAPAALAALNSIPPSELDSIHKLLLASAEFSKHALESREAQKAGTARALALLEEVLSELGDSEVRLRAEATWLSGAILEQEGQLEKALNHYKQSATIKELDPERACQLASIALESGLELELDTAFRLLSQAAEEFFPVSVPALQARVLIRRGRKDAARARFEAALQAYEDECEISTNAAVAIGLTALDLGDFERGLLLLKTLSQVDIRIAVLCARMAKLNGDDGAARSFYAAAISNSAGTHNAEIRIEYAAYLRGQGLAAEVLEVTRQLDERDDRVAQLRAEALYNAGDLVGANALLNMHRNGPLEWPARMGSYISLRRQDWSGAEQWLEKWRALRPELLTPAMYLAELLLRSERLGDASELLRSAPYTEASLQDRVHYSRLLFLTGNPTEALQVAYENLRAGYDEEEAQYTYFVLAMETQSDRSISDEVSIGSSVFLETDSGDTLAYVLVESDPKSGFGEIAQDSPLGKKLLGGKVGDSIVLREGRPGLASKINEIGDKRTHAVRWAAKRLERSNPVSPKVWAIRLPQSDNGQTDFSELIESLREKVDRESKILALVQEKIWPLAAAEELLDLRTEQLYPRLINDPARRILTEDMDIMPAVKVARERQCVLTRSALFTFQALGILDLLESLFSRIVLHPLLVGELQAELGEYRQRAARGSAGLVLRDNQPFFQEVSPEQAGVQFAAHQQLIDRVLAIGREVPLPLNYETHRTGIWERMTFAAFSASIVASEHDVPLFVDDLALRRCAAHSFGVRGFSSYAMLRVALESGVIDIARFRDLEAGLLVAGYEAVPLTRRGLEKVLATPGWPPTAINRVLLRFPVIRADLFSLMNAAKVATYVLKNGALERPEEDIGMLAQHVFAVLLAKADVSSIARAVEMLIGREFALLPLQRDRVLRVWSGFLTEDHIDRGA